MHWRNASQSVSSRQAFHSEQQFFSAHVLHAAFGSISCLSVHEPVLPASPLLPLMQSSKAVFLLVQPLVTVTAPLLSQVTAVGLPPVPSPAVQSVSACHSSAQLAVVAAFLPALQAVSHFAVSSHEVERPPMMRQ